MSFRRPIPNWRSGHNSEWNSFSEHLHQNWIKRSESFGSDIDFGGGERASPLYRLLLIAVCIYK